MVKINDILNLLMKTPIGTIKVDERLGWMSDPEGMKAKKKRDSSVCGICWLGYPSLSRLDSSETCLDNTCLGNICLENN